MREIQRIIGPVAVAAALASLTLAVIAAGPTTTSAPNQPPLTYNAVTDTKYYPKPELPELGPAGSIIKDPTFGCPILRLTDEKTDNGQAVVTPAGAEQNPWNTDSTLFCVLTSGQQNIPYRFDPKTMTASRIKDLPYLPDIMGVAPFSYHDPNVCWGKAAGRDVIVKYNFATGKTEDVVDVAKVTGLPVVGMHAFTISANDVICLTFGGKIQNADPYCLAYDTKTGEKHVYDTKEGKIDGKSVPGTGFTQHSSHISPDGRYVELFAGGGRGGVLFWDIQKGEVYELKNKAAGHMVQGYGDLVNMADTWYIRAIGPETITKPQALMEHPAGEKYFYYDSHTSWNNARPGLKTPVVLSTYHHEGQPGGDPKSAWGDEIIAIATDGSQKVWRFAHHRSLVHAPPGMLARAAGSQPGSRPTSRPATGAASQLGEGDYNFWDCPRGNVSQDGMFYMFTSNWEDTLGKDSKGRFRDDVFIVKLTSASK